MTLLQQVSHIISKALSIYILLILVRVVLSWIREMQFTQFYRILSEICDPYLNLFRRIRLRVGMFDFSPVLAVLALQFVQLFFENIASARFTPAMFLVFIVVSILQIAHSLAQFCAILLAVRLVLSLSKKDDGRIFASLDDTIRRIGTSIIRIFNKNAFVGWNQIVAVAFSAALFASVLLGTVIRLISRFLIR